MAAETAFPLSETRLEQATISGITWRLVPFLFLLYIVAYLDRINVGFAALQLKEHSWFTDEVLGTGAGMFFLGYFLFQVPSNLILQKVGAKRWVAVLMVVWGIVSSCTMFVHSVKTFYLARFLLGVAEAGFFPGVIFYLKIWFPAQARARTVAWFMTATALSAVVGGPLSGALLGIHGKGLQGWQWMFLIEGLPAIVLGFVVLRFLTDRPEKADWLPDSQRTWLIETLENEKKHITSAASADPSNLLVVLLNLGLLSVVYFGLNVCSYGISLWLPSLIRSVSGSSNFVIGSLTAIPYVAAAIAMVLVGQHSDHSGERRWHTSMCALVAAVSFAGAAYFVARGSIAPLMALTTMGAMAQFSMMGPFWAMPTSFLKGTWAAVGIAVINSLGNLGGFVGPYIIGLVKSETGGFRGGLLVIAAALAVASVSALMTRPSSTAPQTNVP